MPLIGSTLVSSTLLGVVAIFFPSLCTIQTSTPTYDDHGDPTDVWVNATGLISLAARIAPASGNEARTPDQIYAVGMFTCVLAGNYPTIVTTQQAVVDSVAYQIVDVGFDDEAIQTRLTLRRVV